MRVNTDAAVQTPVPGKDSPVALPAITPGEIVEMASDGKLAEILTELFTRYFKHACQHAIGRGVPAAYAEDLVADSIIRVATQIADGKVHDPASCWPYLRRAMHNQWLNTVVRNARSIAVEDLPDSGTASAESIYLRESNAAELRRCASDMPPKWATAFKGYYFDGKPPAEVAEEMGISRIYVNQLLCRARERFVENCTRHHIRPPSSP